VRTYLQSFNLFEHWRRFWFEKQPPFAICIYRIFFGLFVLETALVEIAPNFSYFYGEKAVINIGVISALWWGRNPVFDLFLLVPQKDIYLIIIFALFVIAAFSLTVGFCTRLSSILVYLGLLSIDRHCPFVLDGGDDLMRVSAFILCFSNAGALYSIDSVLARKNKQDTVPLVKPWAQRLLQIQIAVAYFYAFLNKAIGHQWQTGSAIYYVTRLDDFIKWVPAPISDFWPLTVFLSYYTLVIEFSLAILVWFKPLRYWVLLGGVILHLGIDTCLNLPGFQWFFISSYVLFIEPADIDMLIARVRGWRQNFIAILSLVGK
jgi:Vitamin K-dependent gamma-carboxylase